MNVDPVHITSAGNERPTAERKPHSVTGPHIAGSGNDAKLEIVRPPNIPAPLAIPEHEVKVVLDTGENNLMVYQVLDKESGALVLQVPSAEQLRVMHQTQELLQQVAARGKTAVEDAPQVPIAKVEGNNNGNKF